MGAAEDALSGEGTPSPRERDDMVATAANNENADDTEGLGHQPASEMEDDEPLTDFLPSSLPPALYLVGTPIGNLADITLRGLHILKTVSAIACEDTRHSGRLLSHHGIRSRLISLNEHNEARRIPELIAQLQQGNSIALISDAGMPTVSDPGQRLVQAVVAAGLRVEGIPGPSAVLTALAASGLPTTPFYFGGFLPHKKGQRNTELTAALHRECTSVYFESPYRIVDTLAMIAEQAADHRVVVARELTKKFEEFKRGPARIVLSHYQAKTPKGEITLVIAPRELPKWVTW